MKRNIYINLELIGILLVGVFFIAYGICDKIGIDAEWLALVLPVIILCGLAFVFVMGIVKIIVGKHHNKKESVRVNTKPKMNKSVGELKQYNISYDLKLVHVYGTLDKLLLVSLCNFDDKNYSLISMYSGEGESFMNKLNEIDNLKIKTWIDFANPKEYEFDINNLVSKVDDSYSFVLEEKFVIDNDEKASKKIETLKKKM